MEQAGSKKAWPQRGLSREEFNKRLDFIVSDMSPEDAAWLRDRLASYTGWETDPGRWAVIAAIEGAAEGSGMRYARMRDLGEALIGLACHQAAAATAAQPPALTPEVVLRAMLRAYEAAAFEALVKHYQAEDGQGEAELDASEAINGLVNELRSEAAHVSAGYPAHDLTTPRLIADYEARLAGTRPLVAPPLEVP